MFDFLGSIFGSLLAIVVFGLMLAVVVFGFRSSERAVKDHDKNRRAREAANTAPNKATPETRI